MDKLTDVLMLSQDLLALCLPFLLPGHMDLLARSHFDRSTQWEAFSYSKCQQLVFDSTGSKASGSPHCALLSNDEGHSIHKRPSV